VATWHCAGDFCGCSTSSPVSTGMGDYVCMAKPFLNVCCQLPNSNQPGHQPPSRQVHDGIGSKRSNRVNWFEVSLCCLEITVVVHDCLHHKAPRYLMVYCIPISNVASRWHLCSARRHYLVVSRRSLSSYGCRAFAVAGPTAWNSLSDDLCDPTLSTDSSRRLLKTRLFSEILVHTAH